MHTVNHASSANYSTSVIRWSSVTAGVVVALGALAALYALGIATGMAAIDVNVAGRVRHVGVFAGVWGVVAPFIALFVGGWIAARGAGAVSKPAGFLHGLTMWGVSALALMWLTCSTVSATAGGLLNVGKGLAQAGQNIVEASGSTLAEGFDGLSHLEGLAGDARREVEKHVQLDGDTLLQPVNAKLKEAGRNPLTLEQVKRAAQRVGREAVAHKQLDKSMVLRAVTEETGISRQDAHTVAEIVTEKFQAARAELDARIEEGRQKLEAARIEAGEKLEVAAQEAARAASKAFAALFVALAFGLLAAGSGATLAAAYNR